MISVRSYLCITRLNLLLYWSFCPCDRLNWHNISAGILVPRIDQTYLDPPSNIFGPVWGILYILVDFTGSRLRNQVKKSHLFTLWLIQLAANSLWTPLFFGLQNIWLALIDILILDIILLLLLIKLKAYDRISMVLLLPYFLWVLFATALNFEIFRLNL